MQSLWPDLKKLINTIMMHTEEWLKDNNLILNKTKTKITLFSPTNSVIESPEKIMIGSRESKLTPFSKFLGVHIDEELNWKYDIANLEGKLGSSVYAFRITSRYLSRSALKTVYHATIESRIRFGLCFYGSTKKSSEDII